MRVGFTGTRQGMSELQLDELRRFLADTFVDLAIHGGCKGADEQFHGVVLANTGANILVMPGKFADGRVNEFEASFDVSERVEWVDAQTHLARNRRIVSECDILVAAPATDFETRGGTWYTINYAKQNGVELVQLKR